VGKYFMDHILLRPGVDISFSQPEVDLRLYHGLHDIAGGRMFGVMTATEALLREEELQNFRIHLVRTKPRYHRPIGSVFSALDRPVYKQEAASDDASISLHLVLEPIPNPESRLSLNPDSLDLFGQAQLNVNWQLKDRDLHNAHRAMELASLEFGRMGLGRGFGDILRDKTTWPDNLEAGRHHCGTTRMHAQAEKGVVDEHCRAHGLKNLYIAGSSVFPTIGYANPTLTIIALALRLADHLKRTYSIS
ncbi:MAG: GMC family oxidoreductase, partial [Arenicellales bacterium]